MYVSQMMLRLALALAPSLVASDLLTVTKYASTCSFRTPGSSAIYTSGTSTYTSPPPASSNAASASVSPIPHAYVCPEYNGQDYTSPSGGIYGVACDLAIIGTTLPGLYIRDKFTSDAIAIYQEGCIIACQKSDACVALTVSVNSCTFYSNVTGTTDAIGSAALTKRAEMLGGVASPTTPSGIVLPNNLGTQFGGVDVTMGFKNPNFIRPGLWNLGGLEENQYETQTVYYGETEGQWTYQVPEFLAFSWASQLNTETVTGETKSDYQQKLSQSFSANIGFAGFGLEVQDTFEEETLVETYYKYASIYARQQIYHVSVRESPATLQSYLSDRARRLFAAGNAKEIVDTFGTHYMSSASFGGMRRFASSIDVRDEGISTKLGQALKLKFAIETEAGEVSGGAGNDNSDATVKKLRDSMETKSSIVFGGTYIDGSKSWIPSLYRNPSAIDFELGSLADLILDPAVKAAVKAEIESRIQKSQVTGSASALAMWEGLGTLRTDTGSGAKANMSTASVNRKQGWFTLGQYGLGSHDWDPTKSKGILIRNIPGSTQQLVKKPDNIQRRWYKSTTRTKHGLYEMTSTNTSYCALSGFYYHNGDALFSHLEIDHAAMVHTSLTRLISSGSQLWNDTGSGTGKERNADMQRVSYGAPDDDSVRIQQLPGGEPEAYFFHTNVAPGEEYRMLDFSKVQFVSNSFVNPP